MNGVQTITMPAHEARQKLDEYREGLLGHAATPEDKGILIGYQALAAGRSLLDLHAVFRACPPDPKGRPALAVARAHWPECFLSVETGGRMRFGHDLGSARHDDRAAWHRRIVLPADTAPAAFRPKSWKSEYRAVVPLIPPNLRPRRALHRYCILFEAEWDPVPPKDPLLIRHLHGSLYAVFAAWDLTPLERAVLAGRLETRGAR